MLTFKIRPWGVLEAFQWDGEPVAGFEQYDPNALKVPLHGDRFQLARIGNWVVTHPNGLCSVWTTEQFNAAYEVLSYE